MNLSASMKVNRFVRLVILASLLLIVLLWIFVIPAQVTFVVSEEGRPFADCRLATINYDEYDNHYPIFFTAPTEVLGRTDNAGKLVWENGHFGIFPIRVDDTIYTISIFPIRKEIVIPIDYKQDMYSVEITVLEKDGTPSCGTPIFFDEGFCESPILAGYIFTDRTDTDGKYMVYVHAGGHMIYVNTMEDKTKFILRPGKNKTKRITIRCS